MEGRRDDVITGAAPQQGCFGRRGGGGDESDRSSCGVELSLRLRTPAAAAEAEEEAPARRSMTIFYNGRVCAVEVTEIKAREIISMANQEILAGQQQQHRDDGHLQDRCSSSSTGIARCGGQVRPAAALSPAGCPRHALATVAAPVMDQAGLSMKRSLQRFLQKREARRAAAVAPPYAGGGRQAQAMRH